MPEPERQETQIPFQEALNEVIKNLKGQPVLLFVLGAGLLFLIAGSRIETFQAVCAPLLIVFVIGLIIWGFLETRKFQQAGLKTGGVKIAPNATVKNSRAETGGISGAPGKANVQTGNIAIGKKAEIHGLKIKTGDVKFGDREQKK